MSRVAGIDLSAREGNPTGLFILPDFVWRTVRRDEEIVEGVRGCDLVVIDAPLSVEIPWRDSEWELIRRGFRPLPLSMGSMRELHERAVKLAERMGRVIETFVSPMRTPLVDVLSKKTGWNRHERDAFLCALTGLAFLEGEVEIFGREHPIYVAKRSYVEGYVRALLQKLPGFGKR